MLAADGILYLTLFQQLIVAAPWLFYNEDGSTLPLDRVLAGGRGGGKTVALLAALWIYCRDFPGAACAVFREERKALHDIVRLASLYFPTCDFDVRFNKSELFFEFSNGSTIVFDGLSDMSSYARGWQGRNLNFCAFEELGSWNSFEMVDLMLSNLRGDGFPNVAFYLCNPGGALHGPIFDRWLADDPQNGDIVMAPNGRPAIIFQSTFEDNVNPKTGKSNVGDQYINSLMSATAHDPVKRELWVHGSWATAGGTYFARSISDNNFVQWFPYPKEYFQQRDDWRFFLGLDHGTAAPAWCGLFAEAKQTTKGMDGDVYRKDSIVCLAEVATNTTEQRNKGDGSSVAEISEEVSAMCREWYGAPRRGVGDPAIFSNHGQPSTIGQEYERHGLMIEPAPRGKRVPGWDVLKQRLSAARPKGERHDGDPGFYINKSFCPQLTWELQNVVADPRNVSDVDTRACDHASDGARFGITSRVIAERQGIQISELRI